MPEKIKHGTRTGYRNGCRCKACTQANSAYWYAQRRAERWDKPLQDVLAVKGALTLDGGKLELPAEIIAEAIDNLTSAIRVEALCVFWRRKKKEGVKL